MTPQQRNLDLLLFVTLMKTCSDYSTYLINTLKHKPKHDFKITISNLDNLIKTIEKTLDPDQIQLLEDLNSEIHNFIMEIKKTQQ